MTVHFSWGTIILLVSLRGGRTGVFSHMWDFDRLSKVAILENRLGVFHLFRSFMLLFLCLMCVPPLLASPTSFRGFGNETVAPAGSPPVTPPIMD